MKNTVSQYFKNKQQGAVLATSLVILLVMTIIGVSSMSTTLLEEKMAGNMRDIDLAFQASESALRDGEKDVRDNINTSSGFSTDCEEGLCIYSSVGGERWKYHGAWDNDTKIRAYKCFTDVMNSEESDSCMASNGNANFGLKGVREQPVYMVENLANAPVSKGSSLVIGYQPSGSSEYYRITARGKGGSGSAVVVLQSIYKK